MSTLSHESILSVDRAFTAPHAPAMLWQDLLLGRARVHSHFFDDAWMVLRMAATSKSTAMSERSQTILSETFTTRAQKVVSIQRGIAPSTVTAALRDALGHLGLECKPSRVPFLLVVVAEAGLLGMPVPGAVCSSKGAEAEAYTTLLLHDPGVWLLARLSSCEAVVARLRLHGKSLDEIARQRGRAVRTVANQLASAYAKLGVCGRSELVALLIAEYLNGRVPTPPTAEVPALASGSCRPNHPQDLVGAERAAAG